MKENGGRSGGFKGKGNAGRPGGFGGKKFGGSGGGKKFGGSGGAGGGKRFGSSSGGFGGGGKKFGSSASSSGGYGSREGGGGGGFSRGPRPEGGGGGGFSRGPRPEGGGGGGFSRGPRPEGGGGGFSRGPRPEGRSGGGGFGGRGRSSAGGGSGFSRGPRPNSGEGRAFGSRGTQEDMFSNSGIGFDGKPRPKFAGNSSGETSQRRPEGGGGFGGREGRSGGYEGRSGGREGGYEGRPRRPEGGGFGGGREGGREGGFSRGPRPEGRSGGYEGRPRRPEGGGFGGGFGGGREGGREGGYEGRPRRPEGGGFGGGREGGGFGGGDRDRKFGERKFGGGDRDRKFGDRKFTPGVRRPEMSFEDDEKPHDRTRTVRYDAQPSAPAEEGAFEEEYIYGRNSVIAFLSGDKAPVNKLYISKDADPDKRLDKIRELARDSKVPIVESDKRKLDTMIGGKDKHQGVIAQLAPQEFLELGEFLEQFDAEKAAIEEAGGSMDGYAIAVLDGIEDPHNVGAIVRSAEAAGIKAILLPQRRSAGLTQTVARVSAGALAHMRVVRIINIVSTLEKLKERGLWIAGLSLEGATDLTTTDLKRPLALVIGSEGTGISRLVAEHCDLMVKIPMLGYVQSLNASVAAGIVFFEVVRQNQLNGKQRAVEGLKVPAESSDAVENSEVSAQS